MMPDIVRCRDCKYRNTLSCLAFRAVYHRCKDCTHNGDCNGPCIDSECAEIVSDDDFCSKGEKREDR